MENIGLMVIKKLQDVVFNSYDLLFAGAGASTSYSIVALCKQFQSSDVTALRVLVVEASTEFFTGVAYGHRSGDNALILTRLDQFYPPEELMQFAVWVRETGCEREIWENEKKDYLDDLAKLSLAEYAITMGRKCVRRRIVGAFISWRVKTALHSLPKTSGLTVHFVQAIAEEASKIRSASNESQLVVTLKATASQKIIESQISVKKLVVAVGTRPRLALNVVGEIPDELIHCIVNDPYEANGLDANHESMMRSIQSRRTGVVKILLLGANASAMESIYLLSKWSKRMEQPIKVVVVSTIGEFPAKISDVVDDSVANVPEIVDYVTQGSITSDGLYKAALKGLKRLKIQGKSLECYNRSIDLAVLNALNAMDDQVRLEFLREKCNALGRYKRRAEKHYHNTMASMLESGELSIISGHLKSVSASQGSVSAKIETSSGELRDIHADGLINCGTSEQLNVHSSNPLIASLVKSGLAEVDASGNCFKTVNGGFSVSNGIHIIGPLLAGNVVNNEPVWHLEHCGRIIRFSKAIAQELLETVEQTREFVEP